ncbi:MAG TPA: hypothetical protein VGP13_03610 [Candidatus Paceibacterota bacterium]|jgi:hypothetical protein|nr:hypothetical protein [Candidatus Paceibacterota bacterium]
MSNSTVALAATNGGIIRVNRQTRPVYPDWMFVHPKLQATGPAKYDLSEVEHWLHPRQMGAGQVMAEVVYEHLMDNRMLESCLSVRDGEEIRKQGIDVFRRFFGNNLLFLWKSVAKPVSPDYDFSRVPFLMDFGDELVLDWYLLTHSMSAGYLAGRLAQ